MKTKLIGVSPRILTVKETRKQFVNENYIDALHTINCDTIMLNMNNYDIDKVLSICDGFLITGGIDINPKWFNEEINGTEQFDDSIDETDKLIIEHALKYKKPLLGICRGHQVINVFMGGSLIQDIGTNHRDCTHMVKSISNEIVNFEDEFTVNSYHHQVIKVLADDLIETVRSVDGYNEGYVSYKYPIICVQWHPERMINSKSSMLIFNAFRNLLDK